MVIREIVQDECSDRRRIGDCSAGERGTRSQNRDTAGERWAVAICAAQLQAVRIVAGVASSGNFPITRIQIGAGIIFARRRDGTLSVQTSDAATHVDLAHMRVGIGRVAVEGEELRSLIWLFSGPVDEDEVDDARDAISTVNGRGAILQDLGASEGPDWEGIDVIEVKGATSVNKDEGVHRANTTKVDGRRAVTAVGIVFSRSVTDE